MKNMTIQQRAERVDYLFKKIAYIAEVVPYKHTDEVYPKIKHLVEELYAITKVQEELHELDYKRIGQKNPIL